MSSIRVGARAPEFRARVAGLADEITLTALRGRPVILAFYPVTFGFMTGIGG
jgi:peroxiredoxin